MGKLFYVRVKCFENILSQFLHLKKHSDSTVQCKVESDSEMPVTLLRLPSSVTMRLRSLTQWCHRHRRDPCEY